MAPIDDGKKDDIFEEDFGDSFDEDLTDIQDEVAEIEASDTDWSEDYADDEFFEEDPNAGAVKETKKKGAPVGLIAMLVGVLAVGGGGYYYASQNNFFGLLGNGNDGVAQTAPAPIDVPDRVKMGETVNMKSAAQEAPKENQIEGSLFSDLDSLPQPDLSKVKVDIEEREKDPNEDIFNIIDSDTGSDALDFSKPLGVESEEQNNNDDLFDSALEAPAMQRTRTNARLSRDDAIDPTASMGDSDFPDIDMSSSAPSQDSAGDGMSNFNMDDFMKADAPEDTAQAEDDLFSDDMPAMDARASNDNATPDFSSGMTDMPSMEDEAASSEQVSKLEQEKAALEEQVASMQMKMSNMAPKSEIDRLEKKVQDLEAQLKNAKSSAPKQASQPAAATTTKAAPKKSTPVAKKATPVDLNNSWSLRGASRGEAVISSKSASTLHTVGVGDIVAGFGRVKSIEIENGKWVVKTTRGTLTQ